MNRGFAILTTLAVGIAGTSAGAHALDLRAPARQTSLPAAPSCPIFPANNVWNKDISSLPVAANSAAMIQSIGASSGLHPDFGSDPSYGIPYNVVSGTQAKSTVSFTWPDESDAGPYPIPANPQIEGGSDAHMLIVDKDHCNLYELYSVSQSGGTWSAGSGAIWNLNSNALRPDGWTSADAAGLPILPGLARYDEYAAGAINHALRFTAVNTRNMHIYPARHDAGKATTTYPPMGLRVRLKAAVNISGFSPQAQVVLAALKKYGMILADNGSNWYISGVSNPSWNDDDLHHLNQIHGSDLEVVDTSNLVNGPDPATATPTRTATPAPATASSTATRIPASPTATPTRTSSTVLTPVADTYVCSGAAKTTNYGASTSLETQHSAALDGNCNAFLRFDLRGVTGTITGATLRLYGRHAGSTPWTGTVGVYPVADTTWSETGTHGMIWLTQPVYGKPGLVSTAIGVSSMYYNWNIGPYVAARQSAGLISLMMVEYAQAPDGQPDQYNAREAQSNKPQLVLTTQ